MKAQLLIALVFCLTALGCAQDQEPAELASEYKNRVTFMLDSTEWTAQSDGSLSAVDEIISAEIGEEPGKRTFMLTAWNIEKGASSSISLYVDSLVMGQRIALNGGPNRASLTVKTPKSTKPTFLTSDAMHAGSILIGSLDSANRRVSGSFEFRAGERAVTQGSFDTRYAAPKPM